MKKKSGSVNNKSPQEKLVHKYIAYKDELEKDINKLAKCKSQAMNLIDKIEDADCLDVYINDTFNLKSGNK